MNKNLLYGHPLKQILLFSLPLLIGNIFQQLYSMSDTIIVGKFVGTNALAAIGVTGSLSFLIIGFITGVASGCGVITAQRYGAKDEEGIRRSIATTIVINIIITIIFTILGVFLARPLLTLMRTPPNIIDDALRYITIIYYGSFATCFYNTMASILRSFGDSKTPLCFLIIASLLNIGLDLSFVINFKMGIQGVAYATVLAQMIAGGCCLIYSWRKYASLHLKRSDFTFDFKFYQAHINIALPMALQFSITSIGFIVVQGALNTFGSATIAAYTAAGKIEQFVLLPFSTFGVTMATFAAQNLGAKQIKRIQIGVKQICIFSVCTAIFGAILVVLFHKVFLSLFIDQTDIKVLEDAQLYLYIVSCFFPALSVIFIYRNTLQGIGISLLPLIVGFAELGIRALVSFTLPHYIGYAGICLASPIAWIFAASILGWKYYHTVHSPSFRQLQGNEDI